MINPISSSLQPQEMIALSTETGSSSQLSLIWKPSASRLSLQPTISLKERTFTISAPLSVEKINIANYPGVIQMTHAWEAIAKQKEAAIDAEESTFEENAFVDCRLMCDGIRYSMENPHPIQEIYACKDRKGNIQGLMVLSIGENDLSIAHLVTHPNNICSFEKHQESDRVRGAGSCLMRKAEEIALERNKREGIVLSPTPLAIPFYEKLGFILEYDEEGIPEMKKPFEDIKPNFCIHRHQSCIAIRYTQKNIPSFLK